VHNKIFREYIESGQCGRSSASTLRKKEARVFLWAGRWHRNNGRDRCAALSRWFAYALLWARTIYILLLSPRSLVLGLIERSILEGRHFWTGLRKMDVATYFPGDISPLFSFRQRSGIFFLFRFAESPPSFFSLSTPITSTNKLYTAFGNSEIRTSMVRTIICRLIRLSSAVLPPLTFRNPTFLTTDPISFWLSWLFLPVIPRPSHIFRTSHASSWEPSRQSFRRALPRETLILDPTLATIPARVTSSR